MIWCRSSGAGQAPETGKSFGFKRVGGWLTLAAALLLLPCAAFAGSPAAPAAPAITAALAASPPAQPSSIQTQLAARGLTAMALTVPRAAVTPPAGVEVDESVQRSTDGGQVLSQMRSWNEPLGQNQLHVEVTTYPSGQYQVAYWVFPKETHGCSRFGWTLYDQDGQPIKSSFWRDDAGLRITGASDFPADLYPDFVPAVAFLRVVDGRRDGAEGRMNQQITPYGYVGLNVSIKDTEEVSVPAGTFSAFKVASRADVGTLLPSWPGFLLHMVTPFVPTSVYYFESDPPYRLLQQTGTPFVGGPEVTSSLVRYYIAGATADAATPPRNKATE